MKQEKMTLLRAGNLEIGHDGKILCRGISFEVCKGDCIMLCGANGSGKSTLLRTIAASGKRHDKSAPNSALWKSEECVTVMIPTGIPKVKGFTLKEFVRLCCYRQSDMGGRLSKVGESALDRALSRLGLSALTSRDISTLSDGEFQKACLASALVRQASVILLDEPTSFLDAETRIAVLTTLRDLCDDAALIFSTHDLHDGMNVCNKVFAIGADGIFRTARPEDDPDIIRTIFHSKA